MWVTCDPAKVYEMRTTVRRYAGSTSGSNASNCVQCGAITAKGGQLPAGGGSGPRLDHLSTRSRTPRRRRAGVDAAERRPAPGLLAEEGSRTEDSRRRVSRRSRAPRLVAEALAGPAAGTRVGPGGAASGRAARFDAGRRDRG